MACCTRDQVRIDMTVMSPRVVAVIFVSAQCVTHGALSIHVDHSGIPYRCRLSSVAAYLRARSVGIPHGGAAFCIICAQEHDVCSAIIVFCIPGSRTAVATIAHIGYVQQRIMNRMRSDSIRGNVSRRWLPVTGGASR